MKKITLITGVLLVSSCGMFTPMSDKEREINYEIDKLYLEYQYKRDSILIEFYRNQESAVPTCNIEGSHYHDGELYEPPVAYFECENCDEID